MYITMSFIYNMCQDFTLYCQRASKRKKALIYVSVYTIVFLLAFLIAYSPIFRRERGFVLRSDGRAQYFPYLLYIGRALRSIVLNLWNGKFAIPLFGLSYGGGGGSYRELRFHGTN